MNPYTKIAFNNKTKELRDILSDPAIADKIKDGDERAMNKLTDEEKEIVELYYKLQLKEND